MVTDRGPVIISAPGRSASTLPGEAASNDARPTPDHHRLGRAGAPVDQQPPAGVGRPTGVIPPYSIPDSSTARSQYIKNVALRTSSSLRTVLLTSARVSARTTQAEQSAPSPGTGHRPRRRSCRRRRAGGRTPRSSPRCRRARGRSRPPRPGGPATTRPAVRRIRGRPRGRDGRGRAGTRGWESGRGGTPTIMWLFHQAVAVVRPCPAAAWGHAGGRGRDLAARLRDRTRVWSSPPRCPIRPSGRDTR